MRSGQSTGDQPVWGLISDVHGNYPALEQALSILAAAGAQRLAFLGDYLGRGESDRCVERIRQVADAAIVGNRDLDWQDRVSTESKTWVLGLPRVAALGSLVVSHGDARLTAALSTSQIGGDFLRAFAEMERLGARVWAFGHSHHARLWRKAGLAGPAEPITASIARIDPHYRYFLNVGTTGLPFPGKGGPSVALVDFGRAEVRHLELTSHRSPQRRITG
jgi:predicted phosphodiesterase